MLSARRLVQSVYTDERIKEYVLDLVGATRRPADAEGVSPDILLGRIFEAVPVP